MVADGTSTRQHALVDQPDQVWPGDVEQAGCFLRGELSVHGKNGDGAILREFANDAHQYLADRAGQFHRFACGTETAWPGWRAWRATRMTIDGTPRDRRRRRIPLSVEGN